MPGGGAFIYHMPVGPELGGKWVQLRTTTPGIIVAPAVAARSDRRRRAQLDDHRRSARRRRASHRLRHRDLCRAGGRRRPLLLADRRHRHPARPRMPAGQASPTSRSRSAPTMQRCTPEGRCDFTIRVTNVGDAPYNGPIVLDEVTAPGNAPVVSGPNAPWVCPPMVSPMSLHASGDHARSRRMGRAEARLRARTRLGRGLHPQLRRVRLHGERLPGSLSARPTTTGPAPRIPICRRGDPECDPPVEEEGRPAHHQGPAWRWPAALDGVCWFNIRVFNNGDRHLCRPADGRRRVSDGRAGFVDLRADPALGLRPDRRRPVPVRPSGRRPGAGSLHPDLACGRSLPDGYPATSSATARR